MPVGARVRGPKSASARPGPCTRPRSADALTRREYHPARQTPASRSYLLAAGAGHLGRPSGVWRLRGLHLDPGSGRMVPVTRVGRSALRAAAPAGRGRGPTSHRTGAHVHHHAPPHLELIVERTYDSGAPLRQAGPAGRRSRRWRLRGVEGSGCAAQQPCDRRPTAAVTATRVNWRGRWRAATPEAPRSQTPANRTELGKQSLKTEVTDPRGSENGLAVCPFPQTEEVTAGRAASGGLPTRQVVAEDGPRPSRELVANADTSESLRRLGGVGKARLGSGVPDPSSTEARPRTAGRAGWCWLLGLQWPHVGGLGTLRPRRHVELDRLALFK